MGRQGAKARKRSLNVQYSNGRGLLFAYHGFLLWRREDVIPEAWLPGHPSAGRFPVSLSANVSVHLSTSMASVKSRYRQLALTLHPDKGNTHPHATTAFVSVTKPYRSIPTTRGGIIRRHVQGPLAVELVFTCSQAENTSFFLNFVTCAAALAAAGALVHHWVPLVLHLRLQSARVPCLGQRGSWL